MINQTDSLAARMWAHYIKKTTIDPDPVAFARSLGFEPDDWQADFLRSKDPRTLLNCSRQSGKSTVTAIKGLHKSLRKDDALILLLSPSLRQSSELFRKVLDFWGQIETVDAEAETKLTLELSTGSRIVSLPGKEGTIRGFSSVDYIAIDEASRVLDPLYLSVRPMLAVSGGSLDAMSTPFGKRGWWFEAWNSSENWRRFEIDATKCPRITKEFLDEERRTLSDFWFMQEYMCQFADSETSSFRYEDIMAAFEGEPAEQWKL